MLYFILLFLVSSIFAAKVSPLFTDFISCEWENGDNFSFALPINPIWMVKVGWIIDQSTMQVGDTFTLHMPCVYKFVTTDKTFKLSHNNIDYATCELKPGDVVLGYSEVSCVINEVPSAGSVSGEATFPVTFNAGLSGAATDLQCSTRFHEGTNTIIFNDGNTEISTTVNFQKDTNHDFDKIAYVHKYIPNLNRFQGYLLAGNCPNGYKSGKLGIQLALTSEVIDCSNAKAHISNMFNDWMYPTAAQNLIASIECGPDSFTVEYEEIPPGYRPFITAFLLDPQFSGTYVNYINTYTCKGEDKEHENDEVVLWKPSKDGMIGVTAQRVIVVTQTYTGSTTSATTLPFETGPGKTMTIQVNVPIPTITTISTYIGISTSYTTISAEPGETAIVVVADPTHTTITETTCWNIDITTTVTIIIYDNPTDIVSIVTPCAVEATTEGETTTDPPDTVDPTTDTTDTVDPTINSTDPIEPTTTEPSDTVSPTITDPTDTVNPTETTGYSIETTEGGTKTDTDVPTFTPEDPTEIITSENTTEGTTAEYTETPIPTRTNEVLPTETKDSTSNETSTDDSTISSTEIETIYSTQEYTGSQECSNSTETENTMTTTLYSTITMTECDEFSSCKTITSIITCSNDDEPADTTIPLSTRYYTLTLIKCSERSCTTTRVSIPCTSNCDKDNTTTSTLKNTISMSISSTRSATTTTAELTSALPCTTCSNIEEGSGSYLTFSNVVTVLFLSVFLL